MCDDKVFLYTSHCIVTLHTCVVTLHTVLLHFTVCCTLHIVGRSGSFRVRVGVKTSLAWLIYSVWSVRKVLTMCDILIIVLSAHHHWNHTKHVVTQVYEDREISITACGSRLISMLFGDITLTLHDAVLINISWVSSSPATLGAEFCVHNVYITSYILLSKAWLCCREWCEVTDAK